MTKFEETIFNTNHILAIAPCCHEKYASVIYTSEEKYYSIYNVKKNIELYCLLNGSTLDGRKTSSRKRYKDVKNPSILISELNIIAAFQVPSADSLDTIWITDVYSARIEDLPNNQTEIILSNQEKLRTPLAAKLVERRREKALRILQANALFYFFSNTFLTHIIANNYKNRIKK